MIIDQFVVQPPVNIGAIIAVVALIAAGFGLILASSSKRLMNVLPISWHAKKLGHRFIYNFTIVGIVLILFGGAIFYSSYNSYKPLPATIKIYEGYISANSGYFIANHPSNQDLSIIKATFSPYVVTAFVGEIGSGNLKLHKQTGLAYGDTYVGRFTLENGATAYVTTTNTTCLVIQIEDGDYLIVGTQDTQTLANSFSQNIHSLTKP